MIGSLLSSPRAVLLGLTLGVAGGTGLYFKGVRDGRASASLAAELVAARQQARMVAQQARVDAQNTILQDRVASLTQEQTNATRRMDRMLHDVVGQLSSRDRRPSGDSAHTDPRAPAGSPPRFGTGAELYREDSEFLAREAARADQIRLALATCTTQYNAVRAALAASAPAARSPQSSPVDPP